MRFVTYDRDGYAQPALLRDGELVDLAGVSSVLDLIRHGEEGLQIARAALGQPGGMPVDQVRLLAPIPEPARFVLATGWNYLGHFDEGVGKRDDEVTKLPEYPSFFAKADTTITGPTDAIPYDATLTEQLDAEAEIAVVIGAGGRSIPVDEVGRHIFGYTLANDVSARDLQRRHGGQWLKGKSIDRSCPLGPYLVTADEFPLSEPLDIKCSINGDVLQDATTDLMIFSIPELVSALSEAMTLRSGDILLTGTPQGVGYARTPPRFLTPGDEVVVSSSRLGELRNRVVEQSLTTYTSEITEAIQHS
jgi:2-keto-4-pentenoate hydratase/2-oxohepta-3-ene-1,7-dioic acid hydratase in catechol pathway